MSKNFWARSAANAWRYLRVAFRIWPGQIALIENVFRQRVLATLRVTQSDYADWMINVVFGGEA